MSIKPVCLTVVKHLNEVVDGRALVMCERLVNYKPHRDWDALDRKFDMSDHTLETSAKETHMTKSIDIYHFQTGKKFTCRWILSPPKFPHFHPIKSHDHYVTYISLKNNSTSEELALFSFISISPSILII